MPTIKTGIFFINFVKGFLILLLYRRVRNGNICVAFQSIPPDNGDEFSVSVLMELKYLWQVCQWFMVNQGIRRAKGQLNALTVVQKAVKFHTE